MSLIHGPAFVGRDGDFVGGELGFVCAADGEGLSGHRHQRVDDAHERIVGKHRAVPEVDACFDIVYA